MLKKVVYTSQVQSRISKQIGPPSKEFDSDRLNRRHKVQWFWRTLSDWLYFNEWIVGSRLAFKRERAPHYLVIR